MATWVKSYLQKHRVAARLFAVTFDICAILILLWHGIAMEIAALIPVAVAFIALAVILNAWFIETSAEVARQQMEHQEQERLRMNALLEQQERSGKMLIRRDLELTRANERLQQLDQMKTDFVTVATHQLRTPLSAVKWTLSMLLKGDVGALTNEQRTFLMKAYESNDRMTELLNNMLLADQVESDKFKPEIVMTDVTDLLDNVLIELQLIAKAKQVSIVKEMGENKKLFALIDSRLMRAILQNLIENAVKYTKTGGTVKVHLEEIAGVSIRIAVADSGIGMSTDQQKNIFTRFYRASNAVRMVPNGSGLGLFIVKRIVEKSRGRIWFESTENVGSTFFVELPVAKQFT